MYFPKAKLFRNWVFSQSFFSSFLKILPFERLFSHAFEPLEFSSEFLDMTTQKDSAALIGIILAFEG
jgi:hypothetical protein